MDTPRTMITFKKDGTKFTYRVGGIALQEGRALFQKVDDNPERGVFWFLPGGRAEMGESSEETLRREMLEELGVEITIERPVFLMENLFMDGDDKDKQVLHHEIGLYFLMSFPPDAYLYREDGPFSRNDEIGSRIVFEWLAIDQLPDLAVWPKFFRRGLSDIPAGVMHVVNNEIQG
jgi:8-oxo-dGTP pyrophosphatase MutT (NUDIX family)